MTLKEIDNQIKDLLILRASMVSESVEDKAQRFINDHQDWFIGQSKDTSQTRWLFCVEAQRMGINGLTISKILGVNHSVVYRYLNGVFVPHAMTPMYDHRKQVIKTFLNN